MKERLEINSDLFGRVFNFDEYLKYAENLVKTNSTSGPVQSPKLIDFTKLNVFRTKRILKRLETSPETVRKFQSINSPMKWFVLVEAWCGDVSQNLPYIYAMSELSDCISLGLIFKNEHQEIMSMFLTDGSESIPKLICLDTESNKVLGTWGPRPGEAQQILLDYKKNPVRPKEEVLEDIQKWYLLDKGQTIQNEFIEAIDKWQSNLSHKLTA